MQNKSKGDRIQCLQATAYDLKTYTEQDIDFLKRLLKNPHMVKYIGEGHIRNEDEIKQFLRWIFNHYEINEHYGLKLLINKETGEKVGHAGIVPQIIEGEGVLEIGYWIDESHWHKGYATEAAKELRDLGLDHLKLKRMISLIQEGNIASEKVALRMGMEKEKQIVLNGKNVNVYAINASH